jgi:hypothetical protein
LRVDSADTRAITSAVARVYLTAFTLLRAMFDVGYFPPNTQPDQQPI